MKQYIVYANDDTELETFNNLKDTYYFIKESKQFDKRNNLTDIFYYVKVEYMTDAERFISEACKIYVRHNKIFLKQI